MNTYPEVGDVLTASDPEPPIGTVVRRVRRGGTSAALRSEDGWHIVYDGGRDPLCDASWYVVAARDVHLTVLYVPEQPDPYEVGRWYLTQVYADPICARHYGEDRLFRSGLGHGHIPLSADDLHWISPVPIPAEYLPEE